MAHIQEFATRVNAAFDKIGAATEGLVADVTQLKADIEALKNASHDPTPEEQALLEGIETRANSMADALDALDSQTTPPTP